MAGVYYLGVERKVAARVNVDGTRGVIDLARECTRLRRLCHYSTAAVSGRRKGVILEEELDEGQTFHNSYEATNFKAEKLARAPRAFIEGIDDLSFYNARKTLELLDGRVRCPPFDSYVDQLIRYVKEVHAARRQKLEDETFDPFE